MVNFAGFEFSATAAALAVMVLSILLMLYRFHRDKSRIDFDLTDLLMEGGKVSKISCVMVGSFLVTSWMMVHMTLGGKMTEGYLGIYVAAWIAPVVARMFGNQPATPPSPPQ